MKEYYRIVELNPPSLETIDILINGYNAVHLRTEVERINTYRHFLARLSKDEIIILRLKYGHMSFDRLTYSEESVFRHNGYIR